MEEGSGDVVESNRPFSAHDLAMGDKITLKGQIFDLQKKLNLLGIEAEMDREKGLTFNPKLEASGYKLQDREPQFSDSVKRAENIRKQRLDMLKATLVHEEAEHCTFAPVINNKSKKIVAQGKVGDRLYAHAVHTRDKVASLSARSRLYDPSSGKRMFTPAVNVRIDPFSNSMSSSRSVSGNSSVAPSESSDTLYQDGILRETRRQQMVKSKIEQDAQLGSTRKINVKSIELLRSKIDRELKGIYEHLDPNDMGEVTYDSLRNAVEMLANQQDLASNSAYKNIYDRADTLWSLLDCDGTGEISREKFMLVCTSIMERDSPAGEWAKPGSMPPNVALLARTGKHKLEDTIAAASLSSIYIVREFLKECTVAFKIGREVRTKGNVREWSRKQQELDDKTAFSPAINKNARALAAQRVKRETRIAQVLEQELDPAKSVEDREAEAVVKALKCHSKSTGGQALSPYMIKRLALFEDIKSKKMAKLKKEQDDRDLRMCTFKPSIVGARPSMASIQLRKLVSDTFDALLVLQDAKRAITGGTAVLSASTGEDRVEQKPFDVNKQNSGHNVVFTRAAVKSDALDSSDYEWIVDALFDSASTQLGLKGVAPGDEEQTFNKLKVCVRMVYIDAKGVILDRLTFTTKLGAMMRKVNMLKDASSLPPSPRLNSSTTGSNIPVVTITLPPPHPLSPSSGNENVNKSRTGSPQRSMPVTPINLKMTEAEKLVNGVAVASSASVVSGIKRTLICRQADALPVHERLYSKSKAPLRAPLQEVDRKDLEELSECTFSPTLPTRDPKLQALLEPGAAGNVKDIKGVKEYLERRANRKEKEAEAEDIFLFNEERYQKSRALYQKHGVKTFNWHTDKRIQEKEAKASVKIKPLLTIDVKLGAALTAQINVCVGDDPSVLASSFCALYGLNEQSKINLTEMVAEHMLRSGAFGEVSFDEDGSEFEEEEEEEVKHIVEVEKVKRLVPNMSTSHGAVEGDEPNTTKQVGVSVLNQDSAEIAKVDSKTNLNIVKEKGIISAIVFDSDSDEDDEGDSDKVESEVHDESVDEESDDEQSGIIAGSEGSTKVGVPTKGLLTMFGGKVNPYRMSALFGRINTEADDGRSSINFTRRKSVSVQNGDLSSEDTPAEPEAISETTQQYLNSYFPEGFDDCGDGI